MRPNICDHDGQHEDIDSSAIRPLSVLRQAAAAAIGPGTMVTHNVRLVRELANGGMGSVWLADHLGLETQVAVKFIAAELLARHPDAATRFKREASMSARLRSVHVVRTFDHGVTADGTPYIVMELLEGCGLDEWLEIEQVLSVRDCAHIVGQIAKALHRAHTLGIVHRDIKPDNIYLCDGDYELFVKVLDFGVAKKTWDPAGQPEVTKTGMVIGTPGFMAPEQAVCSKAIDHRADLWSLAAVAYYALTGEVPYADRDEDELPFARMMRGDLTPPTELRADLPAALDDWFARTLSADPDVRHGSALALADSFERALQDTAALEDPAEPTADEPSLDDSPRSSRPAMYSLFDGVSSWETTDVMNERQRKAANDRDSAPALVVPLRLVPLRQMPMRQSAAPPLAPPSPWPAAAPSKRNLHALAAVAAAVTFTTAASIIALSLLL
jgi:serine/threonine-protein kinase